MTSPTFSILSSAYRTEHQVAGMIESVLAQTSPDWELIVVDNGLSDAMAAEVGRYTSDPRIRLVRQENRGVSGGVNAAAAVARGRYFAVLHSDDHLTPAYCARMAEVLDTRPDVDAVCCDAYLRTVANGELLHRSFRGLLTPAGSPRRPDPTVTLADVLAGRPLYYVGAIRREAWEWAGGFSSDPPNVEDRLLFLKLVESGRTLVEIPDRLSVYMIEETSATFEPARARQMQVSLEQIGRAAAEASGRPEDRVAFEAGLRRSGYTRALSRARTAFAGGHVDVARSEVGAAWRYRRTLRAGALLVGLTVAPGLLRTVHPTKRRLSQSIGVLGARVAGAAGRVVGR